MAFIIQSSSINTGVSNAVNLVAGDELWVLPGVFLASTVSSGVFSAGGVTIENHGTIIGNVDGVDVGVEGQTSRITNGVDGIISGEVAIRVDGTHFIINHGQITCPAGFGFGIFTTGGGDTYNYGSISARYGFFNSSNSAAHLVTTYNFGTVTGTTFSYYGLGSLAVEHVVNAGTMTGRVQLGDGAGSTFDTSQGRVFGVIQGGNGGNTLTGSAFDDVIGGGIGADVIKGNAGDDTLSAGGGVDTMIGGDGDDIYYADVFNDVVSETNAVLATGGDDLVNFAGTSGTFTLGLNVERLALGGASAINGTGNSLANTITGNSLANVLNGGLGIDTMIGRDGSDTYYANVFNDVVTETNAVLATGGNDLVVFTGASGTFTLGLNVERLTLSGISAINGTGNALANTLIGNAAANTLSGLGGNDAINGGLGIDTMNGGDGNDTYYADVFNDVVTETNAVLATGGNDLVNFIGTAGTFTLGLNVERLTLGGGSAINGTGNALANTIIGNAASNVLNGGLGNDTLIGGLGNDFFLFNTLPNSATNRDTISDFNVVADTIRLENTGIFTALGAATGVLGAALFKNLTTGGAVDASDRILYNDTTGAVFYDIDGSGAAAAIQFATIVGAPTLTNADFVVI
jgi:Ca2+-binding RTX toxin-like protein